MDPHYSYYPSTNPWNTSSPPVGSSVYESNHFSFPLSSDISYPVAQPSVNPNILRNQNLAPSVYESHHSFIPPPNDLSYPVVQPPGNPNVLGNQDSSVVVDFDYAKDSSTCPWNTYSPPVGSSVYESSRASFPPFSDSSFQSTQLPVDTRVLETQNSNRYPTTSGVQCLWETDGQICNRWHQSPEELGSHIDDVHMPKGMKVCHWKNCDRQGKPLQDRFKLANHLRVHTGETPFECDLCGKRFARAVYRTAHQTTHTGEKPYLCPESGCQKRFTRYEDFRRHKKTHSKPKPYGCLKCDQMFSCPSTLGKHMKEHRREKSTESSDSGESSTGALCVSESPAPAYNNLAVSHSVRESNHASFSSFSDLSYPCALPPVNPNVLENQNIYRYPTNSGVQCSWETNGRICSRWYQSSEELASHISSTHVPAGMVNCHWKGCDRQGKPLLARNKLLKHLQVHTGETPFGCDICGKQFAWNSNLKTHRRIHTGEKPFWCPVDGCSERFTFSNQLLEHKKNHLKPKPYGCKECDLRYSCRASLAKHMKRNHGEKAAGNSGTGESSTSALSVSENPAPAYYNQANIPNYAQVEDHPNFYYDNYQDDCHHYNNYGYHPM